MKNPYSVGQKVQIVHDMSFVGRAPSLVHTSVVTRVTRCRVFVQGREWPASTPRKFNLDEQYHAFTGKSVGGVNYSIQPYV